MKSIGLPLVATLALSLAVAQANSSSNDTPLRGVSPRRANLYLPDRSHNWKCLDGSKVIPFSAVNDDYCDCPDGSDEPGTSACGTGYFHCANVGHVASDIKSSRVNDGVCDEECCDGSDEYDGQTHCPNICDQVGAEAVLERKRIQKIEVQGSRLRKTYIQHGQETKIKMVEDLLELRQRTDQVQKEAAEARDKLNAANEKLEEFLEGSKATREAARRVQLQPLIALQTKRFEHAKESKAYLIKALKELKENYNKNFHDMAVKNTVSGFDDFMSLEPAEETAEEEGEAKAEEAPAYTPPTFGQEPEEGAHVSPDQQFNSLQDETYTLQREIGKLHDLLTGMKHEYNTEYNDEEVLKAIKIADDFEEQEWNTDLAEFKGQEPIDIPVEDSDDSPEAEDLKLIADLAQQDSNSASDEERDVADRIQEIERKQGVDFGKDDTFVKMLDECFEFKDIEKFSHWVGNDYSVQMYSGGTKCWNGPDRSVKLVMSCGTVNEIISVTEPEKCEYVFKMQTPAVCAVLEDDETEDEALEVVPEETPSQPQGKTHDEL
ncbi:hypothetical protein BGZ83_007437 [Gryganskiella cystojenkinii]|nr:hypothetical protein BGZ83_007437 [Gryganskiella cystojenkinii]